MKFAAAIVILSALSIYYYFSFAKMSQARLQNRKAAAPVINSHLSSATNCVNYFFDLQMKSEIDKWKKWKITLQN